jgi:membrane protease subunit HflC
LGKLSLDSEGVGPGLHFKAPFIDTVFRFDRKVLSLETATERFLTKEQKDVQVDAVVKWQIYDVQKYFQSTRGDEERARITLTQIIKDRLRDEFNKREVREVVTTARFEMIERLTKSADDAAEQLGINVVDVRIKRIELPDEVSESVFNRMRSERTQVANRLRSQGEQEATTRRANADREASITVAEAERDAQRLRGEGDAEAARIYADAYNADTEFYAFHRSLEAYREAFANDGNVLVLDPKSEFFKYFEESK